MEIREITEDRFIECMAIDFPNFKISKSNLTHPTSQFVISFYSLILRNTIELNDPDEIWNITEDQRSYINSYHPEAVTFGQHVWAHNLHSAIKYVFNHLSENGSEFVYSDILFPENTPRRSFVFMALMLNFYWYTNDLTEELNDDTTACLEKTELKSTLVAKKEKLIAQLRDLEFQKCHYAESYKDQKKFVMTKTDLNNQKEVEMKELQTEEEEIKKDIDKIEEEEQNLQAALIKKQNEKNYYESLIVSDERQVQDIYNSFAIKKDECVKRMKTLEEQVKMSSNKLSQSTQILELQKKLNMFLKEEKFVDPQGKVKGFQSLKDLITASSEKKKKLFEEELELDQKILEAEEAVKRLKCEYSEQEKEHQSILKIRKEKIGVVESQIEKLKTNHSHMFGVIKKDSEQVNEIVAAKTELTTKCKKLEKEISSIDSKHKSAYKSHAKEMKAVLDYVENIFDDQKEDGVSLHSIILKPDD